jgi:hypothetical protein
MKSNILKLIVIVLIIQNFSKNSFSQSFLPIGSLLSINDHINCIINDTIIKFNNNGENNFDLRFLKNKHYGDYYVKNGLGLIKLYQQGSLCNPMSYFTMYMYVLLIEKNKGFLYKCAESDICWNNKVPHGCLFTSDEKEILGFIKNYSEFNFNNIVSNYNKILFLYHLISFAEIENINPDFTRVFRLVQPKIQLSYPIITTKDLNNFLIIINTKGFMSFYTKVAYLTQPIERESHEKIYNIEKRYELKYLFEKIDSLNRSFLQASALDIKDDIERKKAFYLYSLPDLKLIKIRLEVKKNKLTIYRKYINPEFIWDYDNSRRIRGVKYFW